MVARKTAAKPKKQDSKISQEIVSIVETLGVTNPLMPKGTFASIIIATPGIRPIVDAYQEIESIDDKQIFIDELYAIYDKEPN